MTPKPRELELGDRVTVAGSDICHKATYYEPAKGTVVQVGVPVSPNVVLVKVDGLTLEPLQFHKRQCTPIKRRERRRVWINLDELKRMGVVTLSSERAALLDLAARDDAGWTEFIEARPGKGRKA